MLYIKYPSIWNAISSGEDFSNSPNFTTFWAPIGASPLIFANLNLLYSHKSEFSSPMDTSNQIWLKIATE